MTMKKLSTIITALLLALFVLPCSVLADGSGYEELLAARDAAAQNVADTESAFISLQEEEKAAEATLSEKQKQYEDALAKEEAASTELDTELEKARKQASDAYQTAAEKEAAAKSEKNKADKALASAKAEIEKAGGENAAEALTAAKKELNVAKKAYKSDKAVVDEGVKGFYRENGNTIAVEVLEAEDFQQYFFTAEKTDMLNGVYGKEWNSTTLENVKESFKYIKRLNEIRAEHGWGPLLVADESMATAQVGVMHYNKTYFHSNGQMGPIQRGRENCCGTHPGEDPYVLWIDEELDPSSPYYGHGHWLLCVGESHAPHYEVTGYGYIKNMAPSNWEWLDYHTQHFWSLDWEWGFGGWDERCSTPITVEAYEKKFLKYYNKVYKALDTTKASYKAARQKVSDLETAYASIQPLIESLPSLEQAATSAQAAYEAATAAAREALSYKNTLDKATTDKVTENKNGTYDAVFAKYKTLKTVMQKCVDAKTKMTAAQAAVAAAQAKLQATIAKRTLYEQDLAMQQQALVNAENALDAVRIDIADLPVAKSALRSWITPEHVYDGMPYTPDMNFLLEDAAMAEVTVQTACEGGTNVGDASLVLSGTGRYKGEAKFAFRILPANMADVTIDGIPESKAYTPGGAYVDEVLTYKNMTLIEGTDYVASYDGNDRKGTATVTFQGIGNYTGLVQRTFTVEGTVIADENGKPVEGILVGIENPQMTYTGTRRTPKFRITHVGIPMEEGRDYDCWTTNAVNAGTATLVIRGRGMYSGTVRTTYKIVPASIGNGKAPNRGFKVTLGQERYSYRNAKVTPKFTVSYNGKKLKEGRDYTYWTANAKEVGTATLGIKGIGSFSGICRTTFQIVRRTAKYVKASLGTSYAYTGKEVRPAPKVWFTVGGVTTKLKSGRDYTVTYKGNVKRGTATATVHLRGNYKGTIPVRFKIR